MKLNIGDEKGKTVALEIEDTKGLQGLKIGEVFKGELIDKTGYEFKITGGSDNAGFPMRKDSDGSARQKVLLSGGVGYKPKRKGMRRRKTVAGNTVSARTAQLNVQVVKKGKAPLADVAPEAPEEGEATADAAEEKKE